jgi:biopolymer transport protein ExbB
MSRRGAAPWIALGFLVYLGPAVALDTSSLARAQADRVESILEPGGPAEPAVVRQSIPSGLVRNVIGVVLLGMSFYLVALVVWMYFEYRRGVAIPDGLVRDLETRLQHERYSEAYERLLADRSFLARVLAPGVRRLPQGTPAAVRAMELASEQVVLEMESRAGYLPTVATLGPMIGLLGTVYGMIVSFGVIARSSDTPQAGDLAAGISTALISTLEGIAIAVPAIVFAGVFRSRIARLAAEVQQRAEGMLEPFSPGTGPGSTHPLAAAALASAGRGRAALP